MSVASFANPRRYLALWFPFLPADRVMRERRSSRSKPSNGARPADPPDLFVFSDLVGGAQRIAAASPDAIAAGLVAGMPLADARARVPEIAAIPFEPEKDDALLGLVAADCDRWTDLVALDPPGGLVLDITGSTGLFGGNHATVDAIRRRLERLGFDTRSACATTPDMARALARFGIPGGRSDGEAVRALPVSALELPEETRTALSRAGLKKIGDVADRPSRLVAARFGEWTTRRLARVLGEENRRIVPLRPRPDCVRETPFPEPIAHRDAAEGALFALAGEVGEILAHRGEGGRHFEASFFRTDGVVRRVAVTAGRPIRDPDTIRRLFRERLDVLDDPLDPGFGFDLVRLAVPVLERFETEQAGLDRRTAESSEIADLLDRLAARFGANRVLRIVPVASHDPERATRFVPLGRDGGTASWPVRNSDDPPMRPLRLLDPPQPVEALAEIPDGPPVRFRWRRIVHDVRLAEGPERIGSEWWRRADAPTRDYYRVEDRDGRRFWLFRAGLYGREAVDPRWFVHGLFA